MADILAPDLFNRVFHMDDHGDAISEAYKLTATPSVADKLYFGIIPAGLEVHLVRLQREATAASVTMSLGYEPVDATKGPTANTTYWFSALAVNAAGGDFSLGNPIRFEQPVKLVGTVGGAGYTAKRVDVIVQGKAIGVK